MIHRKPPPQPPDSDPGPPSTDFIINRSERADHAREVLKHHDSRTRVVCTLGRGWLAGWKEIGVYCGFGGPKGTSASRVGLKMEREWGMPVRRLPDGRPRAIPYELDQWLIAFTDILRNSDKPEQGHTPATRKDWRTARAEQE